METHQSDAVKIIYRARSRHEEAAQRQAAENTITPELGRSVCAMADNDSADKAATPVPAQAVSTPSPAPLSTAGALSPTPGTSGASLSPTRPPYIPQFTAATQMILKRMKGEPSSLSSALAAASATARPEIKQATYEDVKRRLIMGMNTSTMTMQMPAPPHAAALPPATTAPAPASASAPAPAPAPLPAGPPLAPKPAPSAARSISLMSSMSAIRRISNGLTAGGKIPSSKPAAAVAKAGGENKPGKTKPSVAPARVAPRSRKRARDQADVESGSSLSSLSDISGDEGGGSGGARQKTGAERPPPAPPAARLTTTKSGRQVQKPATYNPAAMEAANKKRHYGKRTAEQALCKSCTRMHSPTNNQIVFCDGCNDSWHQRCHDPWIPDGVVRDTSKNWFCTACRAKHAKHDRPHGGSSSGGSKRLKAEHTPPRAKAGTPSKTGTPRTDGNWPPKTVQQKRAYLSTLSQQDLLGLLMSSLELHPDLPIFPAAPPSEPNNSSDGAGGAPQQQQQMPRSFFTAATTDGLFPRADAHPNAPVNYVRKTTMTNTTATTTTTTTNNSGSGSGSGSGNGSSARSGSKARTGGKNQKNNGSAAPLPEKDGSQDRQGDNNNNNNNNNNNDDDEFDPLAPPWPKPGMGIYSRLPPESEDAEHLVDDDDYEAFSVILFDEKGRKIEENGIKV